MNYELFLNEFIMIPLKGVMSSSYKANRVGFKNTLLTGKLIKVDDEFLYLGENDGGQLFVHSLVPRINVGAVFTGDSSFYDGDEPIEYPLDSEIN